MKKLIFLLAVVFTFSNAMAQTAWTTMYKVAPENMQTAKDAIGKKTKKFIEYMLAVLLVLTGLFILIK